MYFHMCCKGTNVAKCGVLYMDEKCKDKYKYEEKYKYKDKYKYQKWQSVVCYIWMGRRRCLALQLSQNTKHPTDQDENTKTNTNMKTHTNTRSKYKCTYKYKNKLQTFEFTLPLPHNPAAPTIDAQDGTFEPSPATNYWCNMTLKIKQQTRKPRSYASPKLCPLAYLLTDGGEV